LEYVLFFVGAFPNIWKIFMELFFTTNHVELEEILNRDLGSDRMVNLALFGPNGYPQRQKRLSRMQMT